ncbi:hypothetical protein ACFL3T_02185 [Patescibacteria group bacterium]
MENPLLSSSSPEEKKPAETTQPTPAVPEAPKAEVAKPVEAKKAPKEKKPFFTTGKIIAFFAVLVVIAAIVGAIIYSQTSERFQGFTLTHVEKPAERTLSGVTTSGESIGADGLILVTGDKDTLVCPTDRGLVSDGTSCVCDASLGLTPTYGQDQNPLRIPIPCTCNDTSIFTNIVGATGSCKPVNYCALTQDVVKAGAANNLNHPTVRTQLDVIMATGINIWYAQNCEKAPLTQEERCNNYINDFKTAYTAKNWDKFNEVLLKMVEEGCISTCKEKLYKEIFYLQTNNLVAAKQVAVEYQAECTGCDNQFNLLALVAQVMSDIDKSTQEAGGTLESEYTAYLKDLAGEYVTGCQCVELEAFVNNPSFDILSLFPASTAIRNATGATGATSASAITSPVVYFNEGVLTIAYAQSTTLSPTILSILQDVLNTHPVCAPEPEPNCSTIDILQPTTDSMEISEDFDPATDKVEFTSTGTDESTAYRISASNDSLVFDGKDADVISYQNSVSLSGGPELDKPVTVFVQAVDDSGNQIGECKDQITVTRKAPEPENCSLLEITLPSNDDMEITEDFDPTTDKVEFTVTGTDNVANYHIFASNDSLVFDGQDSNIYSDYKTVSLSGNPYVDDPVTLTVQAMEVTGRPMTECIDSIVISRAPEPSDPVCRSLSIVSPAEADQEGSAAFVIPAGGFVDQPLTVEIDGDQGSWANLTYSTTTGNADITFDSANPLTIDALTVLMNGRPTTNDSETIEVVALDPETQQPLTDCLDTFTVTVDNDTPPSLSYIPPEEEDAPPSLSYTPPEEEDAPPSLSYTPPEEEEPPPSIAYTPPDDRDRNGPGGGTRVEPADPDVPAPVHGAAPDEPSEPAPTYVAAGDPLHAAPATPQTGPGLIIPLIGVALGGAWMRRKRK